MSASQVSPENINKLDKAVRCNIYSLNKSAELTPFLQLAKKKKVELASLGEWTHINCLDSSAQEKIFDEILQDVIAATSSNNTVDQGVPMEPPSDVLPDGVSGNARTTKAMEEVPGGTITFVFEKASSSITEL
jgi:DNA repair and recombination protein RAD54B